MCILYRENVHSLSPYDIDINAIHQHFTELGVRFIQELLTYPTNIEKQNKFLFDIYQNSSIICSNLFAELQEMDRHNYIKFNVEATVKKPNALYITKPITISSTYENCFKKLEAYENDT